ncbi:MAG: 23S rRNA (pseudouridine(1915)-N(3))-methyltransferase RlmH [Lewinellaceae bacterium]|nr:23S rRNA (pseudouridine(1915)-N(3))-methyltransferase RlmH [Saprospiraceae bacterium]MCB9306191.1 23S rRNA (pseudouridine(1915)-N(3))-methyltransferase RlmH [Lewinellaceae bacterium]
MKIELWAIGKTSEPYLETGCAIFEKRIKNYLPFSFSILPDIKPRVGDGQRLKQEEGKMLLSKINADDYLVLLDERGREYASTELAAWMERRLSASHRRIIFLIGGAFGFSPEVYERANEQLSLSKLTFSHQMVRLFMLEQLYRAMTILKNEPYHNS